jgi:hypothetical protein
LLGHRPLDPGGEDHLADLAGGGIFVTQQQVLRNLLGNGRAALGALAGTDLRGIIDYRAREAGEIHAMMREKGLVLGG